MIERLHPISISPVIIWDTYSVVRAYIFGSNTYFLDDLSPCAVIRPCTRERPVLCYSTMILSRLPLALNGRTPRRATLAILHIFNVRQRNSRNVTVVGNLGWGGSSGGPKSRTTTRSVTRRARVCVSWKTRPASKVCILVASYRATRGSGYYSNLRAL